MKNTLHNNIEVFSSKYNKTDLNIVFTQKSLWLSKQDICALFSIEEKRLNYEFMKIFSDGIFSKKENRARFMLEWKKVVEFYRLGVIISLGYRIKATEGTKYIIHTNRIIKNRLSKVSQKKVMESTKKETHLEKSIDMVSKALAFVHSMRRLEIRKRIHA